jgi:hypothetical protein
VRLVTSWDQDMAASSGSPRRSRAVTSSRSGSTVDRHPVHHLHRDLGIDLDRHPRPVGHVPPQWSVTYRFIIAAVAMARWRVEGAQPEARPRRDDRRADLGFTQFCVNFNSVYLAERFITSGWWRRCSRCC